MEDFYQVLGVPPTASQEEIKERFRFLAHAYHPDRFASSAHKKEAEDAFKKINDAYQILSNPGKRTEYDKKRSTQTAGFEKDLRRQHQDDAVQRRAKEEQQRRERAEAESQRSEEERRKREDHTKEEGSPRRRSFMDYLLYALPGVFLVGLALGGYSEMDLGPTMVFAGTGLVLILAGVVVTQRVVYTQLNRNYYLNLVALLVLWAAAIVMLLAGKEAGTPFVAWLVYISYRFYKNKGHLPRI